MPLVSRQTPLSSSKSRFKEKTAEFCMRLIHYAAHLVTFTAAARAAENLFRNKIRAESNMLIPALHQKSKNLSSFGAESIKAEARASARAHIC